VAQGFSGASITEIIEAKTSKSKKTRETVFDYEPCEYSVLSVPNEKRDSKATKLISRGVSEAAETGGRERLRSSGKIPRREF
jgi:hypothetical protein